MTIRLRCAECQRKLKVPDEALGKKVQCPACGARFLGHVTPETPPAAPQRQAPPPAGWTSSSVPHEPSQHAQDFEPIESISSEGMDPIEEAAFADLASGADEPGVSKVVEEVGDESESDLIEEAVEEEDEKAPPRKKKSRALLYLGLALVVLLLLGGAGAYVAYLFLNGSL